VALDQFTGRAWNKSSEVRRSERSLEGPGLFQLGTTVALNRLTTQTVFLEAIESPVLFLASRPVAIQGDFTGVRVDDEGSVQVRRHQPARVIYTARSDLTQPDARRLRQDFQTDPVTFGRYLQLPEDLDPRISARANAIVVNVQARNRYDVAKAIAAQLQEDYGYSLEMRAGGPDPLADFLFNVKTGHCEYFSTAMAVMLRTQDIPARVVNGFLPGEYNEAAGAYTVRQSDAHSWVEVFFPESSSWVTFDPTPAAGREVLSRTGLAAQLGKYAEAFELMWFQYVVGYDKQEQRSLATALQNNLYDYRRTLAQFAAAGRQIVAARPRALPGIALVLAGAFLIIFAAKRVRRFGWRRSLKLRPGRETPPRSPVLFYERLIGLLARRGVERDAHLTPLEFAGDLDLEPALTITRAYNRVRFGGQQLSAAELQEIETTLARLERESSASS
jgi:hypothetical protein